MLLAKLLTAKSYETLQHIATPAMISVVQVFESFTIISNDNNIVWCLWYRLKHVSLLFDSGAMAVLYGGYSLVSKQCIYGNSFVLWQ